MEDAASQTNKAFNHVRQVHGRSHADRDGGDSSGGLAEDEGEVTGGGGRVVILGEGMGKGKVVIFFCSL